jgi:hypothetical protein
MTGWKTIAMLASLAGCAGVQTTRQTDFAPGRWIGEIDHDGFLQPLALDIERQDDAYRGEWRSAVRSRPLENVEVQGDQVRFETDKLRFVGHVSGSTLSGTVSDKGANARLGEFSVTQGEPGRAVYNPGSEWSAEMIP